MHIYNGISPSKQVIPPHNSSTNLALFPKASLISLSELLCGRVACLPQAEPDFIFVSFLCQCAYRVPDTRKKTGTFITAKLKNTVMGILSPLTPALALA